MCSCAVHVRQVVSALKLAKWWINHKTIFPTFNEVFLFMMVHLTLSAQIERDFSAASLVSPSNRVSLDARYFQAQLCTLVNFLHLVHSEDIRLLNPCQPNKWAKRYWLMVSACQGNVHGHAYVRVVQKLHSGSYS